MKIQLMIVLCALGLAATAFADERDGQDRLIVLNPGQSQQLHHLRVSCALADDTAMLPVCTLIYGHADAANLTCPDGYGYGVAVNGLFVGQGCHTTGADALEHIRTLRETKSCQ